MPYQEAPVLTYAIATHRRRPLIDVTAQKLERQLLGLVLGDGARANALDEAGRVVLAGIPFVHRREHLVGLVNRANRSLVEHDQILVRDHGRDLYDPIVVRVEPGHFEIDPDEIGSAIQVEGPPWVRIVTVTLRRGRD